VMLIPFPGERVGRLEVGILRNVNNSAAYIVLTGALPLGEETATLSRQFETIAKSFQAVTIDMHGLKEVSPAGQGVLARLPGIAAAAGANLTLRRPPVSAGLPVLIGVCAAYPTKVA